MEVDFVTLGDASERLQVPPPTLRNWTDQVEEFNLHFVKRNNRNERIYYDTDIDIFRYIKDLKTEYGRKTTMKDIVNMLRNMEDRFVFRSEEEAPIAEPSNKTAELLSPDDVQRLMENQRVQALLSYVIAETTNQVRLEVKEEMELQREQMMLEVAQSREDLIKALTLEIRSGITSENEKDREKLIKELKEEVRKEIKMDEIKEEVRKEIASENEKRQLELKEFQETQSQRDEEQRKFINKRDIESMTAIKELLELKKQENENSKGFFAKLFGK